MVLVERLVLLGSLGNRKIKNDTLILSLLASCGSKPEWNDPGNSVGHIGIPLASSDLLIKKKDKDEAQKFCLQCFIDYYIIWLL